MITYPTVLILGAGASCPYGFPTGEELKNTICKILLDPKEPITQLINNGRESLSPDISKFVTSLRQSGQYSIDAFLEKRREHEIIGKMSLAAVLFYRERQSRQYFNQNNCWYQRFYKNLIENCAGIDDFPNNKISILTYNYDRSLENYLFTSLKHTFGVDDKKCAEQMDKFNIIHLHGHLGKLDWQGGTI